MLQSRHEALGLMLTKKGQPSHFIGICMGVSPEYVIDGCEFPCGGWELSSDLLKGDKAS